MRTENSEFVQEYCVQGARTCKRLLILRGSVLSYLYILIKSAKDEAIKSKKKECKEYFAFIKTSNDHRDKLRNELEAVNKNREKNVSFFSHGAN